MLQSLPGAVCNVSGNAVTGTRNMQAYHSTMCFHHHGYLTIIPCTMLTQMCILSTCVARLTHAVVLKVLATKEIRSWILHRQWTPSCASRSSEHVGCWQLSTKPASGLGEVRPSLHPSLPHECHVPSHPLTATECKQICVAMTLLLRMRPYCQCSMQIAHYSVI